MRQTTSKKASGRRKNKHSTPKKAKADSAGLIRQLQDKLLALGDSVDAIPAAEIEKTAKAISQLIASVEKADAFLRANGDAEYGGGLSEPARLDLLRKIKKMVENGALDELADNDDA